MLKNERMNVVHTAHCFCCILLWLPRRALNECQACDTRPEPRLSVTTVDAVPARLLNCCFHSLRYQRSLSAARKLGATMDVLKAVQTYVDKMITEVTGMKVLLLDAHTVSAVGTACTDSADSDSLARHDAV